MKKPENALKTAFVFCTFLELTILSYLILQFKYIQNSPIVYVFIVISLANAFVLASIAAAMRRLSISDVLMKEYKKRNESLLPMFEEMRDIQHDLRNQLAVLASSRRLPKEEPGISAFASEVENRMKKLSLMLHLDNILICSLLVDKYLEARNKDVFLEVKSFTRNFECVLDDFEMITVLSNLLQNAIEAAPAGSSVHVEFRKDREAAYIAVSNKGSLGNLQAEELLNRNFTTKSGGRGIGLDIVNRLVKACGGRIDLLEGPGTVTFEITIPVQKKKKISI